MSYRLLIDLEVYDFLTRLTANERRQLRTRFAQIQESPSGFRDSEELDLNGRLMGCSIQGKFAIYFWDDFPDRQVKILRIEYADGWLGKSR